MGVHHSDNNRWLFAGQPARQQVPKVYTPSMDGFERFVRESVGLDSAVPGDGQAAMRDPMKGEKRDETASHSLAGCGDAGHGGMLRHVFAPATRTQRRGNRCRGGRCDRRNYRG